ncbi:MAG: hypothetical protein ACOYXU_08540 [Nitrospirota bacterium]
MRPTWLKSWLIRNTPPCQEVVRILSDAMDRPIPLRRRIAVRLHFLICQWCERYQKQVGLIRTLARSTEAGSPADTPDTSNARLSDEARERFKRLTLKDPQ